MPGKKTVKSELQKLIDSCGTPKDYLIAIYEAKYIDKEVWAQGVPVDQMAYFKATGDHGKVRALIEQNNRQAHERINPKKETPPPASRLPYKDDDVGF